MTLDRVSTAGGYPLTRIDCINATACCHSSACVRARGVKKQEGQTGGRRSKKGGERDLCEQEQSGSSLCTAWPSGGIWTRNVTGQGGKSQEPRAPAHLGAVLHHRNHFKVNVSLNKAKRRSRRRLIVINAAALNHQQPARRRYLK